LRISLLIVALVLIVGPERAQARNVELRFSIADAMADAGLKRKIGNGVAFFFGDQPTPLVVKTFGDFVTKSMINAFRKSDAIA
jgi:hypothetical protein